jgi:FAD/FMN-containing dehydrogenase
MLVTTPELWPINATKIMKEKNIVPDQLKQLFENIWFPWEDKYNTERVYFSLRIQQRPLFIVKPINTTELETILNYVTEKALTIRIMNGRHSSALVSSEVLVDMSLFRKLEIITVKSEKTKLQETKSEKLESEEQLVVGAGNTQGSVNEFLFDQNGREIHSHFGSFIHPRINTEAFPGGSAATVGACSIASMGGIGTLCRTYGLTANSVISYTITLPPTETEKSKTVVASENSYPDLYWALRGGAGNNFGIISETLFTVIEVPSVITYTVTWPFSEVADVLRAWDKHNNLPNNFNEDLSLFYNPAMKPETINNASHKTVRAKTYSNSKRGMELDGIYLMKDEESFNHAKKKIEKRLRCLPRGNVTINPPIKYSDLYRQKVRNRAYFNFSIIQPIFSNDLHIEKSISLINQAKRNKLPGPLSIVFTLLGGIIKDTSSSATAFYPRKKKYFIDINVFWQEIRATESMENWTVEAINTYFHKEHTYFYVGFPVTFSTLPYYNDPEIYYGKNTKRLLKIKREIDPLNILTPTGTLP